ncbi:tyrosine-type recombinase/integrase [Enterobacter ludwigii]|uniref:tyrosine-type recombinase/integrase n=1 Tax=Enterobacter ludwigii TaxID=299767 RepID=UPI003976C512
MTYIILTTCRAGEARFMCWSDIDFKNRVWTIAAERMKAGIQHRVSLPNQALVVLEKNAWIASSSRIPFPA